MTLWNLIRDFFVINVFGGYASDRTEYNSNIIGLLARDGAQQGSNSSQVYMDFGGVWSSNQVPVRISIADWLSSTFTIITLILLVFFLYIFVKWIFKLFSGLLR